MARDQNWTSAAVAHAKGAPAPTGNLNGVRRSILQVRVGAAALIVGSLQFVGLEAVAAGAWTSPHYSYALNYMSDLGVPGPASVFQGRVIDSPLAAAINTAFILEGLLVIGGTTLISSLMAGSWRYLLIGAAVVEGIALVLLGLFHGSSSVAGPSLAIHFTAATVAILLGNLTPLVLGIGNRPLGMPPWFRLLSVALPVVGIVSGVLLPLGLYAHQFDGVLERASVYAFLGWNIAFGIFLLGSRGRMGDARASRRRAA